MVAVAGWEKLRLRQYEQEILKIPIPTERKRQKDRMQGGMRVRVSEKNKKSKCSKSVYYVNC